MYSLQRLPLVIIVCLLSIFLLVGCDNQSVPTSAAAEPNVQAEVVFKVQVPDGTPDSDVIYLDLVDEVTGLAFNITRYQMERVSPRIFQIRVPVTIGSIVKYRYSRQGSLSTVEYNADQEQVRYRVLSVAGHTSVSDMVAAWIDIPYSGETGILEGKVVDQNGEPVGNQLISVAGKTYISGSNGLFRIINIEPGVHNLVIFSMDGNHQTFQQGVEIAQNAVTPANIVIQNNSSVVKITFKVQVPANTPPDVTLRLIANHPSFGNTYGDVRAGLSVIASRAPILTSLGNGLYSITVELPVGYDFRYKYSLGDGFWNAELTSTGGFVTHQLVIPSQDTIINDVVSTWNTTDKKSIRFEVTTPANTPPTDSVSIQFRTYTWFEPIPMYSAGNNHWIFTLTNPLNLFDKIQYRFCRNDQCDIAYDQKIGVEESYVREIDLAEAPEVVEDVVDEWSYWPANSAPTTIVAVNVNPVGDTFFAGIEQTEYFHPGQVPYLASAYSRFVDIGANWFIIDPSWHYSEKITTSPVAAMKPGVDASLDDVKGMISLAQSKGLKVAVFPRLLSQNVDELWWKKQALDAGWWNAWYDEYEEFIVNYAIIASQNNVPALIIGGAEAAPSLPGGTIPNTDIPSGAPVDAIERWERIIEHIRNVYGGQIVWAIPSNLISNAPGFLNDIDQIYVLFSEPLSSTSNTDLDTLRSTAGGILDMQIYPLYEEFQRPIILGVFYPSIKNASNGCSLPEDTCRSFDYTEPVDLNEQANIYNALLIETNNRSWINGFVARGYYPAVSLKDKSASINGKPAGDLLWYWFPRILGIVQ